MNPTNYRSIFCENIRKLRQSNHLTLEEMASALKINVAELQSLEEGTVPLNLSADMVFHISNRFHIDPGNLFIPME